MIAAIAIHGASARQDIAFELTLMQKELVCGVITILILILRKLMQIRLFKELAKFLILPKQILTLYPVEQAQKSC